MAKKIINGIQYAIGAVIFRGDNGEEVLMMKREGIEDIGWEPIKGAIHIGETEEQALMREVGEEAGINVRIVKKLPIPYEGEIPDQGSKVRVCASIFACEYISGDINLGESEHKNYRWMTLEEAVNKMWIKEGGKFIRKAHEAYLTTKIN